MEELFTLNYKTSRKITQRWREPIMKIFHLILNLYYEGPIEKPKKGLREMPRTHGGGEIRKKRNGSI